MTSDLLADARALGPELVRLRRALHRQPETGLHLPRTQEAVLAELSGLDGVELSTGTALSSVVAVVRGTAAPGPGASVLLRADMDALPLTEAGGWEHASRVPGAMHACGHDLHTAMLVGAARLLSERRHRLAGDAVLAFQPGEEGHDGARLMLDEGLLAAAGRPPVAAYALHVTSTSPLGRYGNRSGPALAASGTLVVTVRGAGGHSAWPHHARDPIPATAELILALQSLVTRQFDALEPVLLGIGTVHAGTAANIVPEQARFEATLRALDDGTMARLAEGAQRVVRGIAAAHGLEADAEYRPGYPVTVNDPAEADFVAGAVAGLHGAERFVRESRPGLVSDDIGRILARVPGVMTGLGACPPGLDPAKAAGNHSPHAVFDDAVVPEGAALFADLALRRLDAAAEAAM